MAENLTNERLASLLTEAEWTPRGLARALNGAFGDGTVSATAPYFWRDRRAVPHAPLPALVAHVLSARLGREVTAAEIWDGRVPESPRLQSAIAGMNRPWSSRAPARWLRTGS